MPEGSGQGRAVLLLGEPLAVVGMIEHLLDEPLDRLPGLVPQILGHAGLLQAGLIDQFRESSAPQPGRPAPRAAGTNRALPGCASSRDRA